LCSRSGGVSGGFVHDNLDPVKWLWGRLYNIPVINKYSNYFYVTEKMQRVAKVHKNSVLADVTFGDAVVGVTKSVMLM
jgi:hypothetical protein